MKRVTIRSRKPLSRSHFFEVVQYEVERDGVIHTHENIILSDDVFVLPITDNDEVYLVSQYRYLLDAVKLEMVAGVIESGETPLEAAKRELKEEAGLTAEHFIKIATLERGASFVKGSWHMYVAKGLSLGEQEPDGFEDISVVKLPIAEAVKKVESGEINTTGAVSGILLMHQLLREGKL